MNGIFVFSCFLHATFYILLIACTNFYHRMYFLFFSFISFFLGLYMCVWVCVGWAWLWNPAKWQHTVHFNTPRRIAEWKKTPAKIHIYGQWTKKERLLWCLNKNTKLFTFTFKMDLFLSFFWQNVYIKFLSMDNKIKMPISTSRRLYFYYLFNFFSGAKRKKTL